MNHGLMVDNMTCELTNPYDEWIDNHPPQYRRQYIYNL